MSQEKSPENFKRVFETIGELGKYAGAVLAYLVAIFKLSPEYPYVVSIITVILTTLFVWIWRWQGITKRHPPPTKERLLVPKSFGEMSTSNKGAIWDAFRSENQDSFVFPLIRRRVEFGTLILITLSALYSAVQDAPRAYEEVSGLECSYARQRNAPRVVIARFYNVSGLEFAFEQNMFSEIISRAEGRTTVCLFEKEIKNIKDASELAGSNPGTIIIWGVNDLDAFQIKITQGNDYPFTGKGLYDSSWKSPPETARYLREWAITYISQFLVIFTELQSQLDGGEETGNHIGKKIGDLKAILDEAIMQPWATGDRKQLAPAYVYLGLLFEYENNQTAVMDAYNKAIELDGNYDPALLNRGSLLSLNEEYDLAMKDFDQLIQMGSYLASAAYANRSGIQPDWQSQRSDLYMAIELDPEEVYYYHLLGISAILEMDFTTANQAYGDSIVYLDRHTRDQFLEDLKPFLEVPELKNPVDNIMNMLRNAKLKK